MENLKKYMNWGDARMFLVRLLFLTIAFSMSYMAYGWASQFKGMISVVVFCAFIAFDLILVPRFPNIVHYFNSIAATIFSIVFMAYIGYLTMGSVIADKEDAAYATLLEKIERKERRISELESNRAGYIMGDDTEGLTIWQDKNSKLLNKLNDQAEKLLDQKQKYNEKNGGKYSDSSVAPIAWLAGLLKVDPDKLNALVLPALWLAILSIQSALSAESHRIRIYRPSLMRGIATLLTMIFGINHHYVQDFKHNRGLNETEKEESKSEKKNKASPQAA